MHPVVERLKERKLVQWALAYLAGAGVAYGTVSGPLAIWGVTNGQLKLLQVALAVGFFLALTLAWYHGEKGAQHVSGAELLILTGIMGLGALGLRLVSGGPPTVATALTVEPETFPSPFAGHQKPIRYDAGGFDLSPDGRHLIYRVQEGLRPILLGVRSWSGEPEARIIDGTVAAFRPAVSTDGQWLAYDQHDTVKVLSMAGGASLAVAEGRDAEWGPNGELYATVDGVVARLDPDRPGVVEPLSALWEDDVRHELYDILPGGVRGLIMVEREVSAEVIRVLDLRSGEMTDVVEGVWPRFVPSGHVLYGVDDGMEKGQVRRRLMALPFDHSRSRARGEPFLVREGLRHWTISDDGKLFFSIPAHVGSTDVGSIDRLIQFVWVDRSGTESPVDPDWVVAIGDDNANWRVSPDGTRLAYRELGDDGYEIWTRDLNSGVQFRLTRDAIEDRWPIWISNDEVAYWVRGGGIWSRAANAISPATLVAQPVFAVAQMSASVDGRLLFLRTSSQIGFEGGRDIYVLQRESAVPRALLTTPFDELGPDLSPNGRYIAYQTTESGESEIEVRAFDDIEGTLWRISVDGGFTPRWSRDGTELFFQNTENEMMVVAADTKSVFRHGQPRRLFGPQPDWVWTDGYGTQYDVAPDGRFIVARLVSASASEGQPKTFLVTNFFAEIERLDPN